MAAEDPINVDEEILADMMQSGIIARRETIQSRGEDQGV